MKKHFTRSLLLLALLFAQATMANQWEDFGIEFKIFLKSLNKINKAVEREYAIDQLALLHRDLFLIERSHLYLLIMVENPGIIDNNLKRTQSQLRKEANLARGRIKNIGKKIRKLKQQTSTLQKLLYGGAYSKKIWPSKVRIEDVPDYHQEHYLLTEGKTALQTTRLSREALETFLKTH